VLMHHRSMVLDDRFARAPAVDPACCDVSLYELLVLLVPLAIEAKGVGPWEIAGRAVSLGHNGMGDLTINIGAPLPSTHSGVESIAPASLKKAGEKAMGDNS
jgi:hypothetical protein